MLGIYSYVSMFYFIDVLILSLTSNGFYMAHDLFWALKVTFLI